MAEAQGDRGPCLTAQVDTFLLGVLVVFPAEHSGISGHFPPTCRRACSKYLIPRPRIPPSSEHTESSRVGKREQIKQG